MSKPSKPAKPTTATHVTSGTPRQAPPPPAKPADPIDALILALAGVVNSPNVVSVKHLFFNRRDGGDMQLSLDMHERDAP